MNNTGTFTPSAATPDQAVVYIYRPTEMANALYSPGLTVNEEFKLYLKNGVISRLSFSPGDYIFGFQAEQKYSGLAPLPLKLTKDTIYYIRVNTSLKISNGNSYKPYERSFKLTLVDSQSAVKEIEDCCLTNKTGSTDLHENRSDDEKPDENFSVDKTQNPFSH